MKLALGCTKCLFVAHVPFDGHKLDAKKLYRAAGWILSLIDPKDQVLAPLCGTCAARVYPPELLKVAIAALE